MDDQDDKAEISEDDAALWKAVTGDVARLKGREYVRGEKREMPREASEPEVAESVVVPKKPTGRYVASGEGLDRRTAERLRKGQIAIEDRLDLHGMNQGEARMALQGFIQGAAARGQRCVLVITGKGRTGALAADMFEAKPGVLKQKVPEWLGEDAMKPLVLKAQIAQPKHGGEGALYVLLRRKRS